MLLNDADTAARVAIPPSAVSKVTYGVITSFISGIKAINEDVSTSKSSGVNRLLLTSCATQNITGSCKHVYHFYHATAEYIGDQGRALL